MINYLYIVTSSNWKGDYGVNYDDDMTILNEFGQEIANEPTQEEKTLAMLIFLLSFVTTIVAPLIIWLTKYKESQYIDHYGREYFNMVISYFIYSLVSGLSIFLLIGIILFPAVVVMGFVFTIIAAIKAYEGEYYRIPFIIRIF